MRNSSSPNFPFGQRVTITPEALDALQHAGELVEHYIGRFAQRDWGAVSAEQRASNATAESTGAPVVGMYVTSAKALLHIATFADRSRTVVMLAGQV